MKNFKYLLIVLLLSGCSNQESPTISEKEESSSIIEESTLSESETDSIIESSSKQEESTSEEEVWPYGNLLLDPSSIEFSFTHENIVDDVLVGSTYDSFLKNASSSELVIPALNGKLIGSAQRVPVPTGSSTILVAVVKSDEEVTKKSINAYMKSVANESFGYTEEQLVSSDIIGISEGSLFDATQTMVAPLGDGLYEVQVVAWYDNENSYTTQMVRTAKYLITK